MPEERERPRPHGDPMESVIDREPEENRAQSQSDANGIPEFDEVRGEQRKRQYDDDAGIVSGID